MALGGHNLSKNRAEPHNSQPKWLCRLV